MFTNIKERENNLRTKQWFEFQLIISTLNIIPIYQQLPYDKIYQPQYQFIEFIETNRHRKAMTKAVSWIHL